MPAPDLISPPAPLIEPPTVRVPPATENVVSCSSIRALATVWFTESAELMTGEVPARMRGSPPRFTLWLLNCSWLRMKPPMSLVLLIVELFVNWMTVAKSEIGFPGGFGCQVTASQLPAVLLVKFVGGTAGTTLTSDEFALSPPGFTTDTT